jgi:hypothetical protein
VLSSRSAEPPPAHSVMELRRSPRVIGVSDSGGSSVPYLL